MAKNILVIKLGALGDFIYALGPMAAIRKAHAEDHITLLTTAPFAKLGQECGYFDAILVDQKPKFYNFYGWLALRSHLNAGQFDRVYDLQNNDRTEIYLHLFSPKPEWVGAAKGASHRNDSPERSARHAFYGHAQTLALGGITNVSLDSLEWMTGSLDGFGLNNRPHVLLVPGCSPQHPEKRWPVECFRQLAAKLLRQGLHPVILGSASESDLAKKIARGMDVTDLTGRTALFDIPTLARHAVGAVGNDTGPMHMIAVTGCPVVMLFSRQASNIILHAPPVPDDANVITLDADNIGDISVADVFEGFMKVKERPRMSGQRISG